MKGLVLPRKIGAAMAPILVLGEMALVRQQANDVDADHRIAH
jgi:hypothetical protein